MTLQNRVDPFGHIHAVPERGLFMGNRGGCFHRKDQTLLPTKWRSHRWIICLLAFKGRRRALMQPGHYTELFFLDEATALSAGHRPCFECQRERAIAFQDALVRAGCYSARPGVDSMDAEIAGNVQRRLSGERVVSDEPLADLPDGVIFQTEKGYFLIRSGKAFPWSFQGYGLGESIPERGRILTPPITRNAFRAGYNPVFHPSLLSA